MTTTTRLALTEDEIRARIAAVPFWYHCIEVAPGIVTPGIDSSAYNLQRMNLPEDLTGKRILDIGAFDGFYTFECERRGAAEVIAIDGNAATGFGVVRELLGSRAPFYQMNVYDLTPATFGEFDLVLCLGVLYHLRYLLLGLERIHAVCRGQLILETAVCDRNFIDPDGTPRALENIDPLLLQTPIVQFYPATEYGKDWSTWWSPNIAALHAMLRSVGFEPYQTISNGVRAFVHCLRVEQPAMATLEWADTASVGNPQVPLATLPAAGDGAVMRTAVAREPQTEQVDKTSLRLLTEVLRMQTERMLHLQRTLDQREAHVADLEARARWLEEQSREARRALAAVANGRVMRILRRLTGSR
jgi:tRNA (mo5U34)-methyltransferase